MWKVLALLVGVSALAAACAHGGDMPTVRAGNEPTSEKARAAGRAAGAGGSHAPGSTGLGAGTMGAGSFSGSGSAR
jgi:hypothetical protein